MKHALNQHRAASGAPRAGRLARLGRGSVAACALVLLAIGSAQAQRQDQGYERPQDPRMQQDLRMQDQRGYERAPEPARDYRYDSREFDQRRQQMQQEQQMRASERRSGRLTPDERRDLRRQINEAGMDLYPPRSRR